MSGLMLTSADFADPSPPSMASLALSDSVSTVASIASTSQPQRPRASLPEELPTTLLAFANLILATASPVLKCLLTRECCSRLRSGQLKSIRPTKAEAKREKENLLETPPREADSVSVWDVKKRYGAVCDPTPILRHAGAKAVVKRAEFSCSVGILHLATALMRARCAGEY